MIERDSSLFSVYFLFEARPDLTLRCLFVGKKRSEVRPENRKSPQLQNWMGPKYFVRPNFCTKLGYSAIFIEFYFLSILRVGSKTHTILFHIVLDSTARFSGFRSKQWNPLTTIHCKGTYTLRRLRLVTLKQDNFYPFIRKTPSHKLNLAVPWNVISRRIN